MKDGEHRHYVHVSAEDAIEAAKTARKHHPKYEITKIEKRRTE